MTLEGLTSRCSLIKRVSFSWTGGGAQITESAFCELVILLSYDNLSSYSCSTWVAARFRALRYVVDVHSSMLRMYCLFCCLTII